MTNMPMARSMPTAVSGPGWMQQAKSQLPTASVIKGSAVLFLFAIALIMNHLGRPFEKFLVGYRIPFMLCAAAAVAALAAGGLRTFSTRTGKALIAFTFWVALSTPFSIWRGGSYAYTKMFIALLVVFFMVIAAGPRTLANLRWLYYTAAFACLFFMVTGGQFDERYQRFSAEGTFGNADDVALLGGLAIPFVVFCGSMIPSTILRMALTVPAVLYLLMSVFKTATRTAIPALALMFCIYLWRASMTQRMMMLAGGMMASVVLLVVLPSAVTQRLGKIFNSFDLDHAQTMSSQDEAMASVTERWDLFKDGIIMAATHPIFGVGPGQYPNYRYNNMRRQNGMTKVWFPSHNTYVQIAAESGIPALTLFLVFMGSIFVTIRRVRWLNRENRHSGWDVGSQMATCLEAAFIYFAICSFFMTCDQHPHHFLLAALALATERICHDLYVERQKGDQAALVTAGTGGLMPAQAPAFPAGMPVSLPAMAARVESPVARAYKFGGRPSQARL